MTQSRSLLIIEPENVANDRASLGIDHEVRVPPIKELHSAHAFNSDGATSKWPGETRRPLR